MKALTASIFCIFFYLTANAQTPDQSTSMNESHAGMVYNNNSIRIKAKRKIMSYDEARSRYNVIKGSPYLHKDRKPKVDLHMNTGEVVENATIQYDCYQDEIIANKGDQNEIVLETAYFERIESPSGELEYPLERVNREKPNKFYEILHSDSSLIFFKDTKVEMINHIRNIPGMQTADEKFIRTVRYYLVRGKRIPVEINLKKDDIFRMIPRQHRAFLKDSMKALDIKKLKHEEDYVRALNYVGGRLKTQPSSNL